MANLDRLFIKLSEELTISIAKRDSLKRSRDALRQDIRDWFIENGKRVPLFSGQGSYAMKTLINPINGNEYDIDDGVYIIGYDNQESSDWPNPSTIHSWIKKAVEDRTKAGVIDKDTCIRVVYSNGYHIDLPAYICKGDNAYLAHKNKGWFVSDPKAFTKWFVSKVKNEKIYGEQLRRIVKYLKAWRDYDQNSFKGIELTILASTFFEKYEGRDDKCLKKTVDGIIANIENNFQCVKPVEPYDDLFADSSEARRKNIIDGLMDLSAHLDKAINESDERKASETLRDMVFGNRFPLGSESKTEKYQASSAPGILRNDGRSAKEYN